MVWGIKHMVLSMLCQIRGNMVKYT